MRGSSEQFFFRAKHAFSPISQKPNLIFCAQFSQSLCLDRKRSRDENSTLFHTLIMTLLLMKARVIESISSDEFQNFTNFIRDYRAHFDSSTPRPKQKFQSTDQGILLRSFFICSRWIYCLDR
jgi:hypothetical protein